jgi:hypothetical protein
MRELIVAGCLLTLLAGGGFAQKKYVKWQTQRECAELGYLLDTSQLDKAYWYLSSEAEFLPRGDPEVARDSCI